MKKIAIGTLLVLAGIFSAAAQNLMQTLAVVKYTESEAVTVKEVKDIVDRAEKDDNRKLTAQEREIVYESLINQKLLLQAAKKAGVNVTAQQVDQSYMFFIMQQLRLPRPLSEKDLNDLFMQRNGVTFTQFFKEQTGMGIEEFKDKMIKPQLIAEEYIKYLYADKLSKIFVSGKEIDEYYELNKISTFSRPETLKMLRVVVFRDNNPDAKSKIEKLLADLKSGKTTIEKLVAEGNEQNSQKSGFLSGYVDVYKTPEYAAALGLNQENFLNLFKEKLDTPSDIVELPQLYHFYVITKKEPERILTLTDVFDYTAQGPRKVVTYIEDTKKQEKANKIFNDGRRETIEKLNSPEYVQRKKTGDELTKALSW